MIVSNLQMTQLNSNTEYAKYFSVKRDEKTLVKVINQPPKDDDVGTCYDMKLV